MRPASRAIELFANLAAGAFLLLALRAALTNAGPHWIAASLLGAWWHTWPISLCAGAAE